MENYQLSLYIKTTMLLKQLKEKKGDMKAMKINNDIKTHLEYLGYAMAPYEDDLLFMKPGFPSTFLTTLSANGILIKGGETLEKIANIKNIVFDKTGTLTTGKFVVSEFKSIEGDEKEIQNIIYNIEKHSSHPIAKSLCSAFERNSHHIELTNIKEEKGIN